MATHGGDSKVGVVGGVRLKHAGRQAALAWTTAKQSWSAMDCLRAPGVRMRHVVGPPVGASRVALSGVPERSQACDGRLSVRDRRLGIGSAACPVGQCRDWPKGVTWQDAARPQHLYNRSTSCLRAVAGNFLPAQCTRGGARDVASRSRVQQGILAAVHNVRYLATFVAHACLCHGPVLAARALDPPCE